MTERQLLLMRHAKSSWNNANMTDHERPLNARGQRDLPSHNIYSSSSIDQVER